MKEFTRKYEDLVRGVLSCFDRMLVRACLQGTPRGPSATPRRQPAGTSA